MIEVLVKAPWSYTQQEICMTHQDEVCGAVERVRGAKMTWYVYAPVAQPWLSLASATVLISILNAIALRTPSPQTHVLSRCCGPIMPSPTLNTWRLLHKAAPSPTTFSYTHFRILGCLSSKSSWTQITLSKSKSLYER